MARRKLRKEALLTYNPYPGNSDFGDRGGGGSSVMEKFHLGHTDISTQTLRMKKPTFWLTPTLVFYLFFSHSYPLCSALCWLQVATIFDKLENLCQNMISKFISHPEAWLAMESDSGTIKQPTPSPAPLDTASLPFTSCDLGQVPLPP